MQPTKIGRSRRRRRRQQKQQSYVFWMGMFVIVHQVIGNLHKSPTAVLAFWLPTVTTTTRSWRRQQQQLAGNNDDMAIRDCTFAELGQVADVIIASFYGNSTSPWKQMYRLGELNRVQQGFPHNEPDKHRMLVALVNDKTGNDLKTHKRIVGFCDIDARTPNQPPFAFNPRPYLSDLCIHPDFRRMGIARALVETCEGYCSNDLQKNELFIRVERSNIAALGMYQKLGYLRIPNHPDDVARSKDVILLKKSLGQSQF